MKLSDQITRRHLFVAFGTSQQSGTLSAVDLAATRDGASVTLTASDGSIAPIAGADASSAGVMTAADKAKLDSLPPAATREFSVLADVPGAGVGPGITHLRTAGYAAPGDGGGALYKRVGAMPTHAFRVQSADGAWWELVPDNAAGVSLPEQAGAVGDGVADDSAAIQAVINRHNALWLPAGKTYRCASGINIGGTATRFRAWGNKAKLLLDGVALSFDPALLPSGNFLTFDWEGIDVERIGVAGNALHIKKQVTPEKLVAQYSIQNCRITSTGKGLVIDKGIIGTLYNVRPDTCAQEAIEATDCNVLSLIDCRPFNSTAVVFNACTNVSIRGGSIEKLTSASGAVQIKGVSEAIKFDTVWFEDNTSHDIVIGADGTQTNTGEIVNCRFRNDTAATAAIRWQAARNFQAKGNRYTGYANPHRWDTADTNVVDCSVQDEIYGAATTDYITNRTGRIAKLDVSSAVVSVNFGTVGAQSTVAVALTTDPFGPGSGLPQQPNDSIVVSAVGDVGANDAIIYKARILFSNSRPVLIAVNPTAAGIAVGTVSLRLDLYRNGFA